MRESEDERGGNGSLKVDRTFDYRDLNYACYKSMVTSDTCTRTVDLNLTC